MTTKLLNESDRAHEEVALKINEEGQKNFAKDFEKLPSVIHLREVWEAKGIHPQDPAFLILEAMLLFDIRHRGAISRLITIEEKSDQFFLQAIQELKLYFENLDKTQEQSNQFSNRSKELCEKIVNLSQTMSDLAITLSKLHESNEKTAKVIQERGLLVTLLNWATPAVCIFLGVMLYHWLFRR